ncbi:PREDICTED: uncharacterized protein LOC108614677 isoform X2 [Drosophila arizonae]|uniref:Uncharacterized protein LOC108614677 isoform X2 n=1 Tax=Drosophila arizonae TaxID=7263 RepID=A0ABM1PB06_DROAR|nr:PREDICTED: uncharacterized protein LOC108614677 isoform X2 [Drosophila arizonae]
MRLIVFSTLLLASWAAGQALDAVDASTYWQTTSFETWPAHSRLQPPVNYDTPAATKSVSAQKIVAASMDNILKPYGAIKGAAQPQPEKLTVDKAAETTSSTQFAALTPYGALKSTIHGNLLLLNSPYYAAYSLPFAYVAPSVGIAAATTPSTTTSTAKSETTDDIPIKKDEEEKETAEDTIETLQKLRAKPQTSAGDLKSDTRLRAAVSRINSDYVIEEIISVPGKHILSSSSRSIKPQTKKATAAKLRKGSGKRPPVKVEATGRTSTSAKNFPQIPFANYFLPYHPEQAQAIQGRKQAALILEPHSKAVVGNGGTAISTPISRALLKKGVPTNVYFNPESVAIAGVGGKAHAAADLEIDLFN